MTASTDQLHHSGSSLDTNDDPDPREEDENVKSIPLTSMPLRRFSIINKDQEVEVNPESQASQFTEISFSPEKNSAPSKDQSLLVPIISFITANYNFTVLAASVVIMEMDTEFKSIASDYGLVTTLKMLSYAGAVFGQFFMGYLGDWLGRRDGMLLTLGLIIIGSLSSALCCWGNALTVLSLMCAFRFVLGVGNGGVYPMSAVSAAEGTSSSKADDRNPRVAFVYLLQGIGLVAPYIFALALYYCTSNAEVIWRILLGIGALPIFCIVFDAFKMRDSEEYEVTKKTHKLRKAFMNGEYWLRLLGTGGCWFLYDIAFYGILLIQPDITSEIFGSDNGVVKQLEHGIILNLIGIPGTLTAVLVIKQMGCKWLQFWGFIAIAGSAGLTGIVAVAYPHSPWAQMSCLILVNYFLNWGTAVSTFVLPAEVYPPECRSTYNGVSAALGKLGAIVGVYSFKAILQNFGVGPLMASAAIVCVAGAIMTWYFIGTPPKTWKGGLSQCFGSLLVSVPFVDLRPRTMRC